MFKVFEIPPKPPKNQEAFILDHGKIENGILKYKDDLTSYGWNIKRFNKLHVGAFVLQRKPGKLTKDRKFEIYAGGMITHISVPDDKGNVVARIENVLKNFVGKIRRKSARLGTFLESVWYEHHLFFRLSKIN